MIEAVSLRGFPATETKRAVTGGGPLAGVNGLSPFSPAELTDAQLAQRVQRGDADSYNTLVTRHMQRAFGVAVRILGQAEDAEDLVQDAFVAALEKIDTFDAERDFAPWFYRILVNRCLNARKSRARRNTVELPADVMSATASPLLETERSELRHHLTLALAKLPEKQRTIVTMFDLEGFSSPEIAEVLDLSDGTVRWHLHQARRVLRDALEPYARRRV